jgi:hypothetical protein
MKPRSRINFKKFSSGHWFIQGSTILDHFPEISNAKLVYNSDAKLLELNYFYYGDESRTVFEFNKTNEFDVVIFMSITEDITYRVLSYIKFEYFIIIIFFTFL